MKFPSLPGPLIFLLFTYPVLAAPTTRNDPFREITHKQPRLGQDQTCHLIPLPPTGPQQTEDELLLSFEDWKAKLLAEGKSNSATGSSGGADSARYTPRTDPNQTVDGSGNGGNEGGGAESKNDRTDPSPHSNNPVPSTSGQTLPQEQLDFGFGEPMLPHFRVPLTDRFNYASMECSARIHKAHKSAKSASSILSSKKDRYMLSPCATKTADGKVENHFVIVELCEDIRIDTVQLANFEFFSGVFKDFTVSVAKTYTPDVPEWTTVGTYRARNIRGVQSFHPPTSLRDFYRYIRIDFHSHYASEFYCPVSLLRVYGLTHLEEWKWDSRANRYEQLQVPAQVLPKKTNVESISSTHVDAVVETLSATQTIDLSTEPSFEAGRVRTKKGAQVSGDTIEPLSEATSTLQNTQSDTNSLPLVNAEPVSVTVTDLPQYPSPAVSHSAFHSSQSTSLPTPQTTEVASGATVRSSPSQATPVISLGSQALIPPPHVSASGGESIYRTIMNRIALLELNATLHARYVEEHTVGVREVLKRLTEEIGRLEGIVR
ncbi:hypothetical protein BDM02DRAFT_1749195 [Thelephora ganbajun]|uniref:Uncharacterized protein n=1 Tax=Thelephora ganbajun TaxID=370292 RepID=A0ACB6ZJK8_THEGA|nr:hypothetical protein BDM02DRAFT_1749195 [Thelephora ganbajun]